jgi:hypothetical protein
MTRIYEQDDGGVTKTFVPKNDIYHLNYGNYTSVEVLRIPLLLASMTSSDSSKFVESTSVSKVIFWLPKFVDQLLFFLN